jgi:hypothetical protein
MAASVPVAANQVAVELMNVSITIFIVLNIKNKKMLLMMK